MSPLTPIEIAAAASDQLERAGYSRIDRERLEDTAGRGRFFEDEYGVVLVVVYETWPAMVEGWAEDQGRLVELISAHMTRADAKAWEGYLVLLTPAVPPEGEESSVEEVRYDVTRVRKLVAAGDELIALSDVERALLPLLPITLSTDLEAETSVLDELPDLLEKEGIEREESRALIDAFREQRPLLEAIHQRRPAL